LVQTASAINIRYIKDTYTILKPEFKQLSPAHGPVWWEKNIVNNMYTYGLIGDNPGQRKGKDGLAYPDVPYGTIRLVRQLFHEVQGSFNLTRAPGAPATYFSPGIIGKLLGEIENARAEIQYIALGKEKESKKVQKATQIQKAMHTQLIKVLGDDETYKTGVLDFYKSLVGKQNIKEKHDFFLRNQKRLITDIVASLEESGFFEVGGKLNNYFYPPFTTYNILLTFLY